MLEILESSNVKSNSILVPRDHAVEFLQMPETVTPSKDTESARLLGLLRKAASPTAEAPPLSAPSIQPQFQAALSSSASKSTSSGNADSSQQKSKALLSLLRNTNNSSTVNNNEMPSSISRTSASSSLNITECKEPAELYTSPLPETNPNIIEELPDLSTIHLQSKNDTLTDVVPISAASASSAVPVLPAAPVVTISRKPTFFRITKNQPGRLQLLVQRGSNNNSNSYNSNNNKNDEQQVVLTAGMNVRPGQFFTIEWALPENWLNAALEKASDLVIGLVRYGTFIVHCFPSFFFLFLVSSCAFKVRRRIRLALLSSRLGRFFAHSNLLQ